MMEVFVEQPLALPGYANYFKMNHEVVYRTAPATPGLLIIAVGVTAVGVTAVKNNLRF